jgi:ubiquinone/menaquinone biosynthesis C-methylase UbiE
MGFYAERVFPWMLDQALDTPVVADLTRQALAPATGHVLEIGFGTARSLPFYPGAVTALSAVEPSHGMSGRGQGRMAAARFPVTLTPGVGEQLPFADARFDTVSLILTLCSVTSPAAVLAQAHRVLKPGGRLLLLEHVASSEPRWARWQRRLDPVQRVLGCGCRLVRDTQADVERAGFQWESVSTRVIDQFPGPAALFPILIGHAVRPGVA